MVDAPLGCRVWYYTSLSAVWSRICVKVHLSINNTSEEGARANHSLLVAKDIVYVSQK